MSLNMKLVKFFGQVESLIRQVNVTSCLPEGTNGKKVNLEPCWVSVNKVCSNGGATYIFSEKIVKDNLNMLQI